MLALRSNFMKYAITLCLLTIALHGNTQDFLKNSVVINLGYGVAGDFQNVPSYSFQFAEDRIEVDRKSTIRARHFSIEYRRFITSKHGFKVSFGTARYGFGLDGELVNSSSQFNDTYKIRYLEFGFSYVHRIQIGDFGHLLIEPGLRFHSDGSPQSGGIFIARADSWSASFFTGYEFPMIGNHFFANIGIQVKAPIQSYSNEILKGPDFSPYFFGLSVGISYQF